MEPEKDPFRLNAGSMGFTTLLVGGQGLAAKSEDLYMEAYASQFGTFERAAHTRVFHPCMVLGIPCAPYVGNTF